MAEFHADVDPAKLRAGGPEPGRGCQRGRPRRHASRRWVASPTITSFTLRWRTTSRTPGRAARHRCAPDSHGLVHSGDVATVSRDHVPQWIRVTADGQDAVCFRSISSRTATGVQIAKEIKALADSAPQMPAGVDRQLVRPEPTVVPRQQQRARRDPDRHRAGRAGAVRVPAQHAGDLDRAIVVPAVLAITVLLLYVLGMSFNMMTLGGMAAAVGLIIDDVIVMIEHIMRRLSEAGALHERAPAPLGSSPGRWPGSPPRRSSSSCPGVSVRRHRRFFKALSLTMASLIISFLLTWLAVPLLAERS